jgi:hypothetical protein
VGDPRHVRDAEVFDPVAHRRSSVSACAASPAAIARLLPRCKQRVNVTVRSVIASLTQQLIVFDDNCDAPIPTSTPARTRSTCRATLVPREHRRPARRGAGCQSAVNASFHSRTRPGRHDTVQDKWVTGRVVLAGHAGREDGHEPSCCESANRRSRHASGWPRVDGNPPEQRGDLRPWRRDATARALGAPAGSRAKAVPRR